MFINDYTDAFIFKIVVIFITVLLAVILGNWIYDNKKEKNK